MADYKYATEDQAWILKYPDTTFSSSSPMYAEYLAYVDAGGETDPYRTDEEWKTYNSQQAASAQASAMKELAVNQQYKDAGLPPVMTDDDEVAVNNHVQLLQGEIDHPTDSDVYNPPLPPGVTPPPYTSLTCTVTRQPGWNDILGYRFVINSMADDFEPTSLAMAVYTNPDCDGYLYTTGAFQWDVTAEEWFAVCPPGQEPGDADINFGVLYGAATLSCFTLDAGIEENTFNVFEPIP